VDIQLFLTSYTYKNLLGTLVPNCKRCGSKRLRKDGKYRSYQQYKCKSCGFRFSFTSDLPKRRFHSRIIDFAVKMYASTGVSLRAIAKRIFDFFKVKVSYRTVHRWVKNFFLPDTSMGVGRVWHADETAIKIKGRVHWLWLVMDRKTRKIITWRLSNGRTYLDALVVMKEAKKKAGKPRVIITDGLWEYRRAIRKTWGWRENPHRYKAGAAFGPNAVIERLNRELKRRLKWFGGFQSRKGAESFIRQWVRNYNTEKVT